MNNFALSAALATAPSSAFGELRERPRFWFPLLLVAASTAGISYWYYSMVDIDWLKAAMSSDMNMQDPRRAAAMGMVTRTTLLGSSVIGAFLTIPMYLLLQALCLLGAAKASRLPLGFKHWFAMASWSVLPALLGIVVAAILLLLSDTTQISLGVTRPLSINELLLHRPAGSPGYGLFNFLSIPALLSWVLMVIGVRTWSQRSWLFSATFVLLPIFVIYALWAFVAFR